MIYNICICIMSFCLASCLFAADDFDKGFSPELVRKYSDKSMNNSMLGIIHKKGEPVTSDMENKNKVKRTISKHNLLNKVLQYLRLKPDDGKMSWDEKLFDAVFVGDVDEVKKALENGANPKNKSILDEHSHIIGNNFEHFAFTSTVPEVIELFTEKWGDEQQKNSKKTLTAYYRDVLKYRKLLESKEKAENQKKDLKSKKKLLFTKKKTLNDRLKKEPNERASISEVFNHIQKQEESINSDYSDLQKTISELDYEIRQYRQLFLKNYY